MAFAVARDGRERPAGESAELQHEVAVETGGARAIDTRTPSARRSVEIACEGDESVAAAISPARSTLNANG